MIKKVIQYKNKNYSISNNEELKQLMEELDLATVEEILNMEDNLTRIKDMVLLIQD